MTFKRGLSQAITYQHLKDRLDAESMLEDLGIEFSYKNGAQFMCHCPDLMGNHSNGDANPSFGYNENKMAYNCFVCGGGNVLDLVKMMKGGTDEEALEFLTEHSSLEPSTASNLLEKVNKIMYPVEKTEVIPNYPLSYIEKFRLIHPYLLERGISKEVIKQFQVGYDEHHCGIVFPHFVKGNLVGWQTRHLLHKDDQFVCEACASEYGKLNRVPKYKNTPGFPKLTSVYGYDTLLTDMAGSDINSVIVVESPMTKLYMASHGYQNVVATFGQFSETQSMLLTNFESVLYWPDNDAAGEQNAQKACKFLMRHTNLKIVPKVPGEKSDAANLEGKELGTYIQSAVPASLYYKI